MLREKKESIARKLDEPYTKRLCGCDAQTKLFTLDKRLRKNSLKWMHICLLFLCCIIPRTSCAVLPAYIWPLAYIYNQTIPVTPPMVVNGGIKQLDDRGLSFDGQTGWIDAGDFEGKE